MVAITLIPHTKTERLAWYAIHFPKIKDQHHLVRLATNPQREILDINERIVAVLIILKDGIKTDDEVRPLLDLVKDENDFPVGEYLDKDKVKRYINRELIDKHTIEIINRKENNALLRGDAALALAKYGLKNQEFIEGLKYILNNMVSDPLFIRGNEVIMYFMNFLAALYKVDKKSALEIMKPFSITEKSVEQCLTYAA